MNQSAGLHRLQALDIKIAQYNSQITQMNTIISDENELIRIQKELNGEKNTLHHFEQQLKEASYQTYSLRIKTEQSESSLYSGTIKNPKEMQDLQNEIKSLKKQIVSEEERELDLMLSVEKQQSIVDELDNRLNTQTALKHGKNEKLVQELSLIKKELDKIHIEREAAEKSLQQKDLDIYNRIRQHKGGVAVVDVIDNTCSSCGAEISQAEWQRARISPEYIYCQGCGRIIYGK
jgi:predicted  nucleic acid-binding Zn-ribbon protein